VILGLSAEQFYELTPRQYHLLLDRHREREKHKEWLAGVVAAAVANFGMGAPKEAIRPADFPLMLIQDTKPKPKRRRINRQRIAQNIREAFNNAMQRMRK
jgi:hypothetical protein